ncbi:MAG TPA: SipW-dependent-type signal peptide-containing protein [Clostridia bacterium]|mgnify:CR=1 FL=1|nr:SipW-dependent-type signal peptide-containing protein [Clostridia bacterium]
MKKKVLLIALAAILLVGASIGGTLAWLTATASVTNTFTVGNITMSLNETTSDYKIVPGRPISKNPKVTVAEGSEKCFVFVKIENDLKLTIDNAETVVGAPDISSAYWQPIEANSNIYVYCGGGNDPKEVDAALGDQALEVFTKVNINGALVTKDNIENLKDKTIKITAYAHQSENTTYETAKTAAKTALG